jgi:hypothetical protein
MRKKYGIQLRGLGRALRPSGIGTLRPKPTGRGGKPLKPKPIRPGKAQGGSVQARPDQPRDKRKKIDPKMDTPRDKLRPSKDSLKQNLKKVGPRQKGLRQLPQDVRNKMGYMKDGGKAKKFPDLTGDGKVTRADVLKGRGVFASGGRPGLYANIHAKRRRGGKMRKKGAKGAPTAANFARAKQTARK